MKLIRLIVLALALSSLAGCGGGGGGAADGGSNSAVSGRVPYLISAPSMTFAVSAWNAAYYDITVTLDADGPTGVLFADLWIMDDTGTNTAHIDLAKIAGTKRWRGSTNAFVPMPAGRYRVDSVHLHDGDPISANPLRSGWYMIMAVFSTSKYSVDERQMSGMNFDYYNTGPTSIPISRVTVTS